MKMRSLLIALPILLCAAPATYAEVNVSFSFSSPGFNIGINVPTYPRLTLVPGYPVYYDRHANSNYFFYDGMYWVYQDDNWYASTWFNGPWDLTAPEYVPLFVLRVPVRYYRRPPAYFRGWRPDAAPHWGAHWGRDWERNRRGWDHWDRRTAPRAAPLPVYQRKFSGDRYPRAIQQQESIRSEHYRYQPHDAVTRQHLEQRSERGNRDSDRGNPDNRDRRGNHDKRDDARAERQVQTPVPQQVRPEQRDARRHEQRQPIQAQPAVQRPSEPQPQLHEAPPRGPAQRAASQGNGREDRSDARGNGRGRDHERDDKGGARDNEKENKREERKHDRR